MPRVHQRLLAPWPLAALACLGLAALSILLPSRPSYDPWSWIVWGREVLEGDLRTDGGPSWKPLPVLFTAPFSLLGDAAPALWLIVARAGALGAIVAAAALGHRLAGRLGAVLAAGLLVFVPALRGPIWLGNSEGILLLCVLGAVERHMAGRWSQAFALGVAAGLLRPEAWPFLGLYAVWLVVRDRSRLALVAAGLMVVPTLWLLPELWGSGSLWRGVERAQMPASDAPGLADQPALTVLRDSFTSTSPVVLLSLLATGVVLGLRRAPRSALAPAAGLAAFGLSWLALVAVMAQLGFSGIERYRIAPLAIIHVLAGAGLAWAFTAALAPLLGRARQFASTGLVAAALAVLASGLASEGRTTAKGLAHEAEVTQDLDNAIVRAGGKQRLLSCGSTYASFFLTPAVAWKLHLHLGEVTAAPRAPGVVLRAQLVLGEPIDPPADALKGAPGRSIIARTEHWEVEAAC